MSTAIEKIQEAMKHAEAARPKAGGFPYLAEALRQAGASRNVWELPSCQSIFHTDVGAIVVQGPPLVSGFADIPSFDQEALICALRTDQAGESTFPQFLEATWKAGVVTYEVDFLGRTVSYYGVAGELYVEDYPTVII